MDSPNDIICQACKECENQEIETGHNSICANINQNNPDVVQEGELISWANLNDGLYHRINKQLSDPFLEDGSKTQTHEACSETINSILDKFKSDINGTEDGFTLSAPAENILSGANVDMNNLISHKVCTNKNISISNENDEEWMKRVLKGIVNEETEIGDQRQESAVNGKMVAINNRPEDTCLCYKTPGCLQCCDIDEYNILTGDQVLLEDSESVSDWLYRGGRLNVSSN